MFVEVCPMQGVMIVRGGSQEKKNWVSKAVNLIWWWILLSIFAMKKWVEKW